MANSLALRLAASPPSYEDPKGEPAQLYVDNGLAMGNSTNPLDLVIKAVFGKPSSWAWGLCRFVPTACQMADSLATRRRRDSAAL